MVLYLIIVLISAVTIGILNGIFNLSAFSAGVPQLIALIIAGIIFQVVVDGAFAIFGRLLPSSLFSPKSSFYNVPNFERKFYEFIKIRKWKDKVLELGCFTNFHKDKIEDPKSPEYVKRYIIEANYGVVIHFALLFLSFAVIFFFPLKVWYCFALPVAIVSVFLNVLPLFILRYNLAKLNKLYSILIKRKIKSAA